VFIVLHIPADSPGLLPVILARNSYLLVDHARNGERIRQGRIYVAPPDQHLLIEGSIIRLVHGPKENLHRPSIDTLFRSAARWAGPRVIGVVPTGARDDGTIGMRAIKQRSGLTIVQDPAEAIFPSMPAKVMRSVAVDYVLPLREIGPTLDNLSRQPADEAREYPVAEEIEIEAKIASQDANYMHAVEAFERRAKEAERNSSLLRQLLLGNEKGDVADPVVESSDELRIS
jgi:two-component system chemotaxis response regulator CheB